MLFCETLLYVCPSILICCYILHLCFPQLVKLDLQHNTLKAVPACILQLPGLIELNLSFNQLSALPAVPEWPSMQVLDISRNHLTSLPSDVSAPCMLILNLAHNDLRTVPPCVYSFRTLTSLNLSDNPELSSLPVGMGRLSNLTSLQLQNLKLDDPPQKVRKDVRDCIDYLNSKRLNAKEFFGMKIVVLGETKAGKSTLVEALKDKDFRHNPTAAVEVTNWQHKVGVRKKMFHFKIWDFGGEEWHYATHQCFFTKKALYVVVFNLTRGDSALEGMKPWLELIACKKLSSQVIIVGTHLDEVPDSKRVKVDAFMSQVGKLVNSYSENQRIQSVSIMSVGLKNKMENVGALKDEIYMQASFCTSQYGQHVMGQKVPASYLSLEKHMEVVRQDALLGKREPIMTADEFRVMIKNWKLSDICYDEDLMDASAFLNDIGLLTHYGDYHHNLHKFFFLDPHWLSDILFKILKSSLLNKKGFICSTNIQLLFEEDELRSKYLDQCLVVLSSYQLAMPLNLKHILVPSKLQENRPDHLQQFGDDEELDVRSKTILFTPDSIVPPGFWSHLLQWTMKSIHRISSSLDGLLSSEQPSNDHSQVCEGQDQTKPTLDPPLTETTSSTTQKDTSVVTHCSPNSPTDPTTLQVYSDSTTDGLELETKQSLIQEPKKILELGVKKNTSFTTTSNMKLDLWQRGLHYSDTDVMFRVEAVDKLRPGHLERGDGVLVIASPNEEGRKILHTLVRCVVYIIKAWYPALDNGYLVTLGQKVACSECVRLKRPQPFEFVVEDMLLELTRNKVSVACCYHPGAAANHAVNLTDIISSLLQYTVTS